MEKRNWDKKRGIGWGRGTDGYWYQYRNWEKTGKRQKHVVHTNPFKAVSYEVKKFQNRNKLKEAQNNTNRPKDQSKHMNKETYDNIQKIKKTVNDYKSKNNRSNEEKVLLDKSKKNINNNKEGALHKENKRKNTLDLKATDPKTGKKFQTNVHTKHYKTGERLGVLTRNQRRAYEADAMGKGGKIKTFEGQVAAFEKETKHGKKHKRETLYRRDLRRKGEYPTRRKPGR